MPSPCSSSSCPLSLPLPSRPPLSLMQPSFFLACSVRLAATGQRTRGEYCTLKSGSQGRIRPEPKNIKNIFLGIALAAVFSSLPPLSPPAHVQCPSDCRRRDWNPSLYVLSSREQFQTSFSNCSLDLRDCFQDYRAVLARRETSSLSNVACAVGDLCGVAR